MRCSCHNSFYSVLDCSEVKWILSYLMWDPVKEPCQFLGLSAGKVWIPVFDCGSCCTAILASGSCYKKHAALRHSCAYERWPVDHCPYLLLWNLTWHAWSTPLKRQHYIAQSLQHLVVLNGPSWHCCTSIFMEPVFWSNVDIFWS
jgi:hypothetical protein